MLGIGGILASAVLAAALNRWPAGKTSPAPHWLVALAQRQAVLNGDAHPSSVSYNIRGNEAVVRLHGHFVCKIACSYPAGAAPPKGTVMTL